MADGRLSQGRRRFFVALALPAFGISLSYTLVTTYLPVLVHSLSGPAVTGVLIASEGVFALVLPTLIGPWSDALGARRRGTRLGGRMPFVFAGAALAVTGLVLMPAGSGSLAGLAAALAVFMVGYFVYYSPYYALFPDLVPEGERGRSQGAQGGLRSSGMLLALAGGGVLLGLWQPLPFLVGAVTVAGVTAGFYLRVRDRLGGGGGDPGGSALAATWGLVRGDRDIRLWAVANSMWEAGIGALRAFVVLYFTEGLGLSLNGASGALALVGVAAIAAAPVSGKVADRYGHRPAMLVALWVFGLGLLVPLFTTNTYFIAGILPVAFCAVVLNTLPYSVLMGLLPEEAHHGAGAGLFGASRGVGVLLGPLLAGVAVATLDSADFLVFAETRGFSAVFAVAGAFLLLSIPVLRRMRTGRGKPG